MKPTTNEIKSIILKEANERSYMMYEKIERDYFTHYETIEIDLCDYGYDNLAIEADIEYGYDSDMVNIEVVGIAHIEVFTDEDSYIIAA